MACRHRFWSALRGVGGMQELLGEHVVDPGEGPCDSSLV
jgi:hypothetical protein